MVRLYSIRRMNIAAGFPAEMKALTDLNVRHGWIGRDQTQAVLGLLENCHHDYSEETTMFCLLCGGLCSGRVPYAIIHPDSG